MATNGSDLANKAVSGVAWSFVERFSVQGITFLLELVIARIVGPENYGLIAMLAIFMAVSQVFIDGGFSTALIQRNDRTEADYSTVFYINVGISLVVYALLYAFAPLIADFFGHPILIAITRLYCLTLVINSLVAVNRTRLTIAVDFKTQSKISLLAAVLSGVVGVTMALFGFGVWAIVWQAIAQAVVNVLASCYYVRWRPRTSFSPDSFRRLFGFGSKLLVATLISSIYSKVYDVVVGKRFSSTALGLYARADKFNQFASSNISGILSRVSLPVLSRIQDDDDRLRNVYRKYMQMSALVVFPLIMGMCGVARPMIEALLGREWLGCVPLLQILTFSYLWDCVVTVNLNLIYAKGRSDYVLRLEVVKKTIAFAILAATLSFGLTVICLGRVAYAIISFYLNTYYTKKLLDYGFWRQLRELMPILLLSLMVAAIGATISHIVRNPYIALALALVTCPLAYTAVCHAAHLGPYQQLLALMAQKPWRQNNEN